MCWHTDVSARPRAFDCALAQHIHKFDYCISNYVSRLKSQTAQQCKSVSHRVVCVHSYAARVCTVLFFDHLMGLKWICTLIEKFPLPTYYHIHSWCLNSFVRICSYCGRNVYYCINLYENGLINAIGGFSNSLKQNVQSILLLNCIFNKLSLTHTHSHRETIWLRNAPINRQPVARCISIDLDNKMFNFRKTRYICVIK